MDSTRTAIKESLFSLLLVFLLDLDDKTDPRTDQYVRSM